MIYARTAATFTATLEGAPTGLTGTLGVRIENTDGTTAVARHTTGITELQAGSGVYAALLTAPDDAGSYVVLWDTGGDQPTYASEDLTVTVGAAPDPLPDSLVPSLEEIAAINLSRTEDSRGNPLGTFTTATTPAAVIVTVLAQTAADKVADRLGPDIPDAFLGRAQSTAALYAAALVEGTAHEPRQALIDMWEKIADNALDALAARIEEVGGGGEEGPSDDALLPLYSFPCAEPLP